MLFTLTSCKADKSGLADSSRFLTVSPNVICPEDKVNIKWEVFPERSPDFCDSSLSSSGRICTTSNDCESDELCRDEQCVAPGDDVQETDFGSGCPADTEITISSIVEATSEDSILHTSDRIFGQKTDMPVSTTTYQALLSTGGVDTPSQPAKVEVLAPGVESSKILDFGTLTCSTAGQQLTFSLGESFDGFDPSSSMQIKRVINRSSAKVILRSENQTRSAVFLNAGASTNNFNGPISRTWIIGIDPIDIPAPNSCSVDTGEFNPVPLSVELVISCN